MSLTLVFTPQLMLVTRVVTPPLMFVALVCTPNRCSLTLFRDALVEPLVGVEVVVDTWLGACMVTAGPTTLLQSLL